MKGQGVPNLESQKTLSLEKRQEGVASLWGKEKTETPATRGRELRGKQRGHIYASTEISQKSKIKTH